jgi:hypothetical protein
MTMKNAPYLGLPPFRFRFSRFSNPKGIESLGVARNRKLPWVKKKKNHNPVGVA